MGASEKTPDYFNLEHDASKPEQRSAPNFDLIFEECEALFKWFCNYNEATKELYLENKEINLPLFKKDARHHYRLSRSVDTVGTIEFTYQRIKASNQKNGFTVEKHPGAPALLLLRNYTDQSPEEIDEYSKMAESAREYILEYASAQGVSSEILELYKRIEVLPTPPLLRREQIGSFLKRSALRPFTEPIGNSSERRFSKKRIAAIGGTALTLLPLPYRSTVFFEAGPISVPKPFVVEAADDTFNKSEHIREGFDKNGPELSAEFGQIVQQGEETELRETRALLGDILDELEHAPTLSADAQSSTDQVRDLYGGPRRLTNLGRRTNIVHDNKLHPDDCEDIGVDMNNHDALLFANITPSLDGKLTAQITTDKIIVCNRSEHAIAQEDINHIYVQVVEREQ